ncbi:MAG TPA: metallophosphoesterase family protein [Verrucomicrobiae bacterium]|nr:metallophosphoesterase family protein [Verrucomicrobiae bacterium]
MKYAIIADIHAHLAALQAVLRDAEQQGCTHTACLGDIVGDFDKPKECVDIIRGMGIPCVKGNLDEYCSSDTNLEGFSPHRAAAIRWTREQLTEDERNWLRNLPLVEKVAGFTIVHGTLDGPQRWGYVFDRLAAAASFMSQDTGVCFIGHTHVPLAFIRDSVVRGGTYSKFGVEPGKRYLVNVGSVGQPRDETRKDPVPKASYVTYDLAEKSVELRRVECPPPGFPPITGGDFPVLPGRAGRDPN